jgi:D-alanine-D-alanine ligase
MTDKKLHVAVLFGGRSGEHEVSLMSARSVMSALDPAKYEVTRVGITHDGKWLTGDDVLEKFEKNKTDGLIPVFVFSDPSERGIYTAEGISGLKKWTDVDVYFPVLHGTFGEDGTLQGLFELADLAYVGAGVVGSAVGMDKGVFKDVMIANQIPVVEMMLVLRAEIEHDISSVIERAEKVSEYPLFTKPANLGSSVGVTKCSNRSDLQEGLMEAAQFDRRILIQKGVKNARESKSVCWAMMTRLPRFVAKCCPAVSFIRMNRNILMAPPGC